jgi:hypothetical protein
LNGGEYAIKTIARSLPSCSISCLDDDLGFLYEGFLPKAHFSKQFFGRPWPWHNWIHKGLSPGFSLGIALMNVGAKLKFIDEAQGDPLPQSLRIGLAWNVFESDLL